MSKRNPTREEQLAVEGFEKFHGKESERILTDSIDWPPDESLWDRDDFMPDRLPKWVSGLGELLAISYIDERTLAHETITFKKPYPILASNFQMTRFQEETLFVVGGKYRVESEENLICGEIPWIEYLSVKSFDDFKPTPYIHEFSFDEEGAGLPWPRPILAQNKAANQIYILRGDSEFGIDRIGRVSGGISG